MSGLETANAPLQGQFLKHRCILMQEILGQGSAIRCHRITDPRLVVTAHTRAQEMLKSPTPEPSIKLPF